MSKQKIAITEESCPDTKKRHIAESVLNHLYGETVQMLADILNQIETDIICNGEAYFRFTKYKGLECIDAREIRSNCNSSVRDILDKTQELVKEQNEKEKPNE